MFYVICFCHYSEYACYDNQTSNSELVIILCTNYVYLQNYQIKNTVLFSCLLSFIYILGQLEGMGFNRELVLEVFFACNKDEELAANYLLDHGHEFDEPQQ